LSGLNCGLVVVVVVDDFDVVAVGVEHVRGVVAGVIARALTRLAVASVAGTSRVGVKPAHVVIVAREADVDVLGRLIGDEQKETV